MQKSNTVYEIYYLIPPLPDGITAHYIRLAAQRASLTASTTSAASRNDDRTEPEKVLKAIKGVVKLVEDGKGTRTLVDHLLELEAQEDAIRARLAAAPADVPDIHPDISQIIGARSGDWRKRYHSWRSAGRLPMAYGR